MKNFLTHLLCIPLTIYMFWMYVSDYVDMKIGHGFFITKPFVYRMLVPKIAEGLMWFRLREDFTYILILTLNCVGIILLSKYFYSLWRSDDQGWMVSYTGFWVLLAVWYKYPKVYDPMTVMLMLLAFIFMAKAQYQHLLWLFPVMCVNRETAFLVAILFAVWTWRKIRLSSWMYMVAYQGVVFILIQSVIRWMYRDSWGSGNELRIMDNVRSWIQFPVPTLLLFLGFALILYVTLKDWNQKPAFLKVAFMSLFPILFALYVLFGYNYEVRVFAELYPIVLMLSIPCKEKTYVTQVQETSQVFRHPQDQIS